MRIASMAIGLLMAAVGTAAAAQDRDTKVRKDREAFEGSRDWIYNDLEAGVRAAAAEDKPLLVVFRCIPCAACQEFDDQVARRDRRVRDLMDQFVCVRIVQANTIDLTRFQFDFDQSFAAVLMHPDMTIYGRFGTRSKHEESRDITLEGLRKAMAAALEMHKRHEQVKPALAGKQVSEAGFKSPGDYPSLAGKYESDLDYEGRVAASCLHCHQIREAERLVYRTAGEPIPDEVLYPSPNPSVVGLIMDPREKARIAEVAADSPAERDDFQAGDEILRLEGQPLLSIADIQWVLHHAPPSGRLSAQVARKGEKLDLVLTLDEGWRRRDDISWRATTWDLRRMGLGGLLLEELLPDERSEAGLPDDSMALRVKHAGEYGDHAVALRAGFRKDDILVAFDGQRGRMTESQLLAHTLQEKRPGDTVAATVLRNGQRKQFKFALQ
ncbi:MAG: Trx7/PDZ domain-containing (seleno)protein [Pirellulales bacterium]